jgi:hypothetical protein
MSGVERFAGWPQGWRFWVLIALIFFFPVVLRPWWLFMASAALYALLVLLLIRGQHNSDQPTE